MAYTVLIADDEKEIRDLLRLYLEKDGYQVLEAEDGRAAVSILEKEEVDLALLDIMMPKMDGYQVLKRIKKWWSLSPINRCRLMKQKKISNGVLGQMK